MINRILVPIDGSHHADKALDYALDLADKYAASIEILNVTTPVSVPMTTYPMQSGAYGGALPDGTAAGTLLPDWATTYSTKVKATNQAMLTAALKKAKNHNPNVKMSTKLVEGWPANQIIEIAKTGDVDLIVMGSRGLSGITSALLGSVSTRVSHEAHCPVLIVK